LHIVCTAVYIAVKLLTDAGREVASCQGVKVVIMIVLGDESTV